MTPAPDPQTTPRSARSAFFHQTMRRLEVEASDASEAYLTAGWDAAVAAERAAEGCWDVAVDYPRPEDHAAADAIWEALDDAAYATADALTCALFDPPVDSR